MKIVLLFCLFFSFKLFAIDGYVKDLNNKAIPFAIVRLQNTDFVTHTNKQGYYFLKNSTYSGFITVAKNSYLIDGVKYIKNSENNITLKKVPNVDNDTYSFTPSLLSNHSSLIKSKQEKVCQNCHTRITQEWKRDIHSTTLQNKNFLAMYFEGFKKDFPNSRGNCISCHAPQSELQKHTLDRNSTFSKVEKESINCDFCHKINAVEDINVNSSGINRIKFRRPLKKDEILFGPMNDVYPRFDAYNSLYEESKFCAGCHDGSFWGIKIYSEYEEWKNSLYATKNISCQKCHMPSSKTSQYIADKKNHGFLRTAKEVHSHKMLGTDNIEFMKNAIDANYTSKIIKNQLHLTINVSNKGAGHHFPTGSPFHYMTLRVDVSDEVNNALPQVSSHYLPRWASKKRSAGKVYAKVFKSASVYGSNMWKHTYPEHFWKPSTLSYDTRIKANETDKIEFIFDIKNKKNIKVNIQLQYVKFNPNITKSMGLKNKRITLYSKSLSIP